MQRILRVAFVVGLTIAILGGLALSLAAAESAQAHPVQRSAPVTFKMTPIAAMPPTVTVVITKGLVITGSLQATPTLQGATRPTATIQVSRALTATPVVTVTRQPAPTEKANEGCSDAPGDGDRRCGSDAEGDRGSSGNAVRRRSSNTEGDGGTPPKRNARGATPSLRATPATQEAADDAVR
ncbi:MAG: hypothetical protein IPK16_31270 [Anaerolineales bacterium]|nr:hypothetical protein [Anaerolineales bacterium]